MPLLHHSRGTVALSRAANGGFLIRVALHDPRRFMQFPTCVSRYPLPLIKRILAVKGPEYLCDEILRDEDPFYIAHHLKTTLMAHAPKTFFSHKRLLDFGCGSGASTMILGRLFPTATIVGVELDPRSLTIARMRAKHYGFRHMRFYQSPRGDTLPHRLGAFDVIVMPAVYEHLLPQERPIIVKLLWTQLKLDGLMFIDETPHRYFPIESHTSGLPIINYLPDRLAHLCVRIFSRRDIRHDTWDALLRKGIRGGTPAEILAHIRRFGGQAELLRPNADIASDPVALWEEGYARHATGKSVAVKQNMRIPLRMFSVITGVALVPYLSLAIRKKR